MVPLLSGCWGLTILKARLLKKRVVRSAAIFTKNVGGCDVCPFFHRNQ